jgi:hypothetical protein
MIMSRITCITWFIGVLILANMLSSGYCQTFSAKVNIQADRLQPEEQAILAELPRLLEDYINNYNWTNENADIIIESRISIVVETVSRQGSEGIFRSQFIINSPSGENFLDRSFEFRYQAGQLIEHQRSYFDPLLSMIDFYVYMVIAGELDCYILLGGTSYYGRARIFVDGGLVSSYAQGWRNRLDELQLITDDDHRPLRGAKFYYYEGLFYIEQRRDVEKAPVYSKKVVDLLDAVHQKRPNSVALKRFLDGHYQEFCKLFTYDQDRENSNAMIQIDNRRREVYEACGSQAPPDRF